MAIAESVPKLVPTIGVGKSILRDFLHDARGDVIMRMHDDDVHGNIWDLVRNSMDAKICVLVWSGISHMIWAGCGSSSDG